MIDMDPIRRKVPGEDIAERVILDALKEMKSFGGGKY